MYIGIRDVCIFQAGYENIAVAMDDLALDSVELAVDRNMSIPSPDGRFGSPKLPVESELEAIESSEIFARLGIHISGLLVANNFNAEDRAAEIDWTVNTLVAAEVMGVDAVRVDAAMTGQQDLPGPQRVDIFAGAVEEILDNTGGGSVPLAVENHGYQGNDPRWLSALLERVRSPRFGVTLDAANFYWAGQPLSQVYEITEQLAPRVCHVHCKNISYPALRREERRQLGWKYGEYVVPVHQGDVDHERIIGMLAEVAYPGGLHLEDESLAKFGRAERKQILREEADYLAELVAQVGHQRYWSESQ